MIAILIAHPKNTLRLITAKSSIQIRLLCPPLFTVAAIKEVIIKRTTMMMIIREAIPTHTKNPSVKKVVALLY